MQYLSDYQTFENKLHLNEAISVHISRHSYDLNDTARDVLSMLARYAVKYPGVAHLKVATIAAHVGKSTITIRRVLNKLSALGIIEKVTFMRKVSGGNGANVYRFLPIDDIPEMIAREEAIEPTETSGEHAENAAEPITSLKQKDLINNTYSSESLPSFYGQFKAFIYGTIGKGNQSLISRLYGVYKAHSTPLLRGQAFDKKSVEQAGRQALKVAVMATKSKHIRNLAGYYNGVLDRMLDRLYFEEMDELGGLPAPVIT